jgi:hypothetical protein
MRRPAERLRAWSRYERLSVGDRRRGPLGAEPFVPLAVQAPVEGGIGSPVEQRLSSQAQIHAGVHGDTLVALAHRLASMAFEHVGQPPSGGLMIRGRCRAVSHVAVDDLGGFGDLLRKRLILLSGDRHGLRTDVEKPTVIQ